MKQLLPRLALLCLPLALLYALEILLPWDTFAFRTWEAVAVSRRLYDLIGLRHLRIPARTTLPGPWVPSITFRKVETGDLGHHTPFAIPREVVWQTDEDGFRTTPDKTRPRLVIVGDSETVGSGLSQEETLAEVLRREHGISAYPFAPADLQAYLSYPRWNEEPPPYVVYEHIERYAREGLAPPNANAPPIHRKFDNHLLQEVEIALNRVQRLVSIEYLQALVNGRKPPIERQGILFLQGEDSGPEPQPQQIETMVKSLQAYAAILRNRGTQLAILVVPDKENTYADLLPGAPGRSFMSQYRCELRKADLVWIELETDFVAAREQGQAPLQKDDTHWSAHGVRLAAHNVAQWIHAGAARP